MKLYATYPDQELCHLISDGDEQAFAVLVNRLWRNIYLHALTYTHSPQASEEITQDIFLQVWLKRETLKEITNFSGWLHILARNKIISLMRVKVQELAGLSEVQSSHDNAIESILVPDLQAEHRQSYQLLLKGIEMLPEKRKAVFKMSRLEGMSNIEIAEKLQMNPVTVSQYLAKALGFLRSYLNNHTDEAILVVLMMYWLH